MIVTNEPALFSYWSIENYFIGILLCMAHVIVNDEPRFSNSLPFLIERSTFIVPSMLPGLLRFILFGDGHLDDLPFFELIPHREVVHDRNLYLLPG